MGEVVSVAEFRETKTPRSKSGVGLFIKNRALFGLVNTFVSSGRRD